MEIEIEELKLIVLELEEKFPNFIIKMETKTNYLKISDLITEHSCEGISLNLSKNDKEIKIQVFNYNCGKLFFCLKYYLKNGLRLNYNLFVLDYELKETSFYQILKNELFETTQFNRIVDITNKQENKNE